MNETLNDIILYFKQTSSSDLKNI